MPRKKIKNYRNKGELPEAFIPIKNVLQGAFSGLGLDKKIKDYELMQYWNVFCEQNLSPSVAKNTKASHIDRDRNLVIKVKSAVVASELKLQKKQIVKKFLEDIKDHSSKISDLNFS